MELVEGVHAFSMLDLIKTEFMTLNFKIYIKMHVIIVEPLLPQLHKVRLKMLLNTFWK